MNRGEKCQLTQRLGQTKFSANYILTPEISLVDLKNMHESRKLLSNIEFPDDNTLNILDSLMLI